jgi:RNA polymerase sigma-70 factor (ECF subfamily)
MNEPGWYQPTAAPLRAYVVRALGGVTHADDIVQDTYLRMLRRPIASDDPTECRAYLWCIARHLLVDHWRRRKREAPLEDRPELPARERDAALRLDIARTFRQLRPRERRLIWLAHIQGASHREIAAALGLGVPSIRVLLLRARRKMARSLRADLRGN